MSGTFFKTLGLAVTILLVMHKAVLGQQDAQYTQYMYNTMAVNPGYTGSKGYFTATALARAQWMGIEGEPQTQTLSMNSPIGYRGVGLGFSLVNDKLGPSSETYFDLNFAYKVRTTKEGSLSLGLKLGGHIINVDWSKGRFKDPDAVFNQNIQNKFAPTIGAGLYFNSAKYYLGLSVPNFTTTKHYSAEYESLAKETSHYFLIGGLVLPLNDRLQFKPAFLTKVVAGAPLSLDLSANFLLDDKIHFGAAYRLGDAMSALIGMRVTENLTVGYAYDKTTSSYKGYNNGTHEIMVKFETFEESRLKSPRFF